MTQTALIDHITETEFRRQVLDLARLLGYLCYFTWTSVNSPPGFPDLVMIRAGRVIFAELKSQKGKLSPRQEEWIGGLADAGAEVYVWRPADFETIKEILERTLK